MSIQAFFPHLAGAFTLVAAAVIYKVLTGDTLSGLINGQDGRASTSKFQLFAWTALTLYSFSALFVALLLAHSAATIDTVPPYLMAAIGLSVVTATAAKSITSAQVGSGQVRKPPLCPDDTDPGAAALLQNEDGSPDLAKAQLLAWTVVAIAVYVYRFVQQVTPGALPDSGSVSLPDIDAVLVPLLGLGHAAYLGTKLVPPSAQPAAAG